MRFFSCACCLHHAELKLKYTNYTLNVRHRLPSITEVTVPWMSDSSDSILLNIAAPNNRGGFLVGYFSFTTVTKSAHGIIKVENKAQGN